MMFQTTNRPSWVVLMLSLLHSSSQASWVDPDTHPAFHTTVPLVETDQREYRLVFSDEFQVDGRTFHDGTDPRWTAINKNDYTNAALHYYSHDNAITNNGVLNITTELKVNLYKAFNEKTKKFYLDKKHVQSAMLQGWNKFCITGGIIEFSAKLPGDPSTGGLWPALWLLGNLARATYVGSSDFMWPFSYNRCDPKNRNSQEINACSKVSHYDLQPGVGRGAPEIDVLETMQGDPSPLPHTHVKRPYLSCSYQVSPGISENRPVLGDRPRKGTWYENLEYGNKTKSELNPFFYGVTLVHEPKSYTYQSDALSSNMHLNESHYQQQHTYRVEWDPPEEDGSGGYIRWFVDDQLMYGVKGESLEITGTTIPSEPMYLLMNTAVSSHWGFPAPCPPGCACKCFECGNPDCACALPAGYCENFPSSMEVDYVRVYQAVDEPKHVLGCSTLTRPTDTFIKGHAERYMSEGDTKMMEPVQRGGAPCEDVNDCGGVQNGKCGSKKHCICLEGFTGPTCLAHDAFYAHESRKPVTPFTLSVIYVPPGLLIIIGLLIVSFLLSLLVTIRRQKKEASYAKLSNGNEDGASRSYDTSASYQNPGITDYALPTNQQNVTYCVVDGRLIDQ